jgi:hypothetical protein
MPDHFIPALCEMDKFPEGEIQLFHGDHDQSTHGKGGGGGGGKDGGGGGDSPRSATDDDAAPRDRVKAAKDAKDGQDEPEDSDDGFMDREDREAAADKIADTHAQARENILDEMRGDPEVTKRYAEVRTAVKDATVKVDKALDVAVKGTKVEGKAALDTAKKGIDRLVEKGNEWGVSAGTLIAFEELYDVHATIQEMVASLN